MAVDVQEVVACTTGTVLEHLLRRVHIHGIAFGKAYSETELQVC